MDSYNTAHLNPSPHGSLKSPSSKSPASKLPASESPSSGLQDSSPKDSFTSAKCPRVPSPPLRSMFEPFNKNRLEWEAFDRSKSRDSDHAIADKLKSLISDIDNSGILDDDKTGGPRSTETKSMPMNRTFLFQEDVDARFTRLDDLSMLYRMEEGLSSNMLTMINDGTAQEFSTFMCHSKEETGEQKFRREAINRCALRQALTETTDAAARSCNLVKLVVEPFDPDSETVDLSFPDRLGDRLDAEKRRRSRWTSRRDVEVNDTLESFFSICQAPNELEINFLSHQEQAAKNRASLCYEKATPGQQRPHAGPPLAAEFAWCFPSSSGHSSTSWYSMNILRQNLGLDRGKA
uniref:Uncharacterized protein n=1 Tax=Phyllosticta capitalensis TaxID=121624 RepID=A0A140CWN0_9PEZI|nr:hypothetical protein [Phyllosticta capitalensis]